MPATRNSRASGSESSSGPYPSPLLRKESNPEEDAEMNDSYTNGDFTITSSDGVIFKVPSFYLRAASAFIRDTYDIGHGAACAIVLDDEESERASSVRMWLDIITGRNGGLPSVDLSTCNRIRNVLYVCRKFDCPQATAAILLLLSDHCSNGALPYHVAIIGAIFDVPELVAKCIRACSDYTAAFEVDIETTPLEGALSNPAYWRWEDWRQVPPDYAWAMQRAYVTAKTDAKRSEKFLALIKKRKGTKDA